MSVEGALLFARYAYPPNELGYCGPVGAQAMLDKTAVEDIESRARKFEGAWGYLEFLAHLVGTDDPLSVDVVTAYWIGSELLEAVEPACLVAHLKDRFVGQPGGTWRSASHRARAHHSFQVFEVYPWASLLREGRPSEPAVNVLHRCRIRKGIVRAVDGESVTVSSRPLVWNGATLRPGEPGLERARWSVKGQALIESPHVGEIVALHWDWVCDVLTAEQASMIERLEESQRAGAGLG